MSMDDFVNTELLKLQSAGLTDRTPFCSEDRQLAEYFDGVLADDERHALERHLADCSFCLARVGALGRLESTQTAKRVPEDVLATAKQMTQKGRPRWARQAPAWAAAAVLTLALASMIDRNGETVNEQGVVPPAISGVPYGVGQLRNVEWAGQKLDVVFPAPDAEVGAGTVIRWSEIPGNTQYNIFILTSEGDVLWTERLAATEWAIAQAPSISAGDTYYFRVEALLSDGRTISSKHRAFRMADQ